MFREIKDRTWCTLNHAAFQKQKNFSPETAIKRYGLYSHENYYFLKNV
jgi:hypothetical protein